MPEYKARLWCKAVWDGRIIGFVFYLAKELEEHIALIALSEKTWLLDNTCIWTVLADSLSSASQMVSSSKMPILCTVRSVGFVLFCNGPLRWAVDIHHRLCPHQRNISDYTSSAYSTSITNLQAATSQLLSLDFFFGICSGLYSYCR